LTVQGRTTREYRAFILGPDGHVQARVDLIYADDENSAREQAKRLVDGHDVELWQLNRKIARSRIRSKTVKDYQASLEKLRRDAAEAALIRDLATDVTKREMFDRLHKHLNRLADEVEAAMKSGKVSP